MAAVRWLCKASMYSHFDKRRAKRPFRSHGNFFPQLNDKFSTEYPAIAVIAVEPVVIHSFVKEARGRGTMQNDRVASFLRQAASNCNKSYLWTNISCVKASHRPIQLSSMFPVSIPLEISFVVSIEHSFLCSWLKHFKQRISFPNRIEMGN